jgi:hypothetical protein
MKGAIVAKRKAVATGTARPIAPRQPNGVSEMIAVYVGRTLGELLNRKDELQKQLAQVEAQIADARNDVGARVAKYLPKGFPTLRRKKTVKPAPRRAAKRTAPPRQVHGRDHETVAAHVIGQKAAAADRTQRSARPRSAPRATRRG